MMEAAMHLGRSCIMFELDGMLCYKYSRIVEVQYTGAKVRMLDQFKLIKDLDNIEK